MDLLADGLVQALAWKPFLFAVLGSFLGIVFAAIPGLTVSMGIILLLPFTFHMASVTSMSLLVGVFVGGMTGGSISAILLNIPGNPAAIVTSLDGHPLARKGRAGVALGVAFFSSFFGGLFSLVCLVTIAPQLADFALKFGAPELASLVLLGLCLICGFAQTSMSKALISGVLGLSFSTVGMDPIDSIPRFTFSVVQIQQGVSFLPVMIGLFAVPEIISGMRGSAVSLPDFSTRLRDLLPSPGIFVGLWKTLAQSSLIGTTIGLLPGTGSAVAAVLSYNTAQRRSSEPESFGKGKLEGVSAPEAANSAMTGGAMIPMLTLGIPGDPVTAVMLGALTIQGLAPGPLLFESHGGFVFSIFGSFFISLFLTIIIALLGIRLFVQVLRVPSGLLFPSIAVFCVIGAFALQNSFFDVFLMIGFGLLGFFMQKFNYPIMPLLLAIILGPVFEKNARMSLILSDGDPGIFFRKPISLVFLVLGLVYLISVFLKRTSLWKKQGST